MSRRAALAAAAAAAVAFAAYAALPQDQAATQGHAAAVPVEDPALVLDAASANNEFAVDFYGLVSPVQGNVFFSPISMYMAFSTVYEGASGGTAEQIRDAFNFRRDAGERYGSIGGLVSHINQDDPYSTLSIANSVWLADWFMPHGSYLGPVREYYAAHVESLDLADDGVDTINAWVEENTNGAIKNVAKPGQFDDLTALVITNAIYFAGEWDTQFPKELTKEADFWTGPSESVRTDHMWLPGGTFDYASLDGLQVLKLPYKGDRLSMLIALPAERDGLPRLEESLAARDIEEWRGSLARTDMAAVIMPKFQMRTAYDLKELLPGLGIVDAFAPALSAFPGIGIDTRDGSSKITITSATQAAFVDVDEVGTEAAAVTMLVGGTDGAGEEVRPLFRADRPFLFMIQDDETGMLLFMGRVADPTA
ncbi:MAG: serpin family protein [Alphaproteobacteria bacterium]|nr:serpin family protein [Alphaproteobacteria bacterium]